MLSFYLSLIDLPEGKRKFEILYEQYHWLMYKTAYNILNDRQAAEDAVHDAFIKVTLFLNSIVDTDSPKTRNFLVIITRNISINMYKMRKRIELLEREIERPDSFGTDDRIIEDESYNELVNEIMELPGRYSDFLFLRYDNDLSIAEIAKMYNMSYTNTQKTIERAKIALNNKLNRIQNKEGESNGTKLYRRDA